jgi:signal transduction histidine kinase
MKWIAWLGVALASCYWFLEASMESTFFNEGTFIERMWPSTDAHEMWMRITVFILLILFGIYAQYLVGGLNKAKDRLLLLNECFLGFGPDPVDNINQLTALCGQLLRASAAFYNRLDQDRLHSWGHWNVPAAARADDDPKGHICDDVIKQGSGDAVIVRNLPKTPYARTDPGIFLYGLRTYIGKAVSLGGAAVGSLCVVYKSDYQPSREDEQLMGIVASAVGVEEVRRRAQIALLESEERLRHLSSELLITQEMERKRLALKLHDSVGQSLSALKFSIEETLETLSTEVEERKIRPLKAAVPLIREVVNEIREIQRDLRPATLDDLGILATIETFCKRFGEIYQSIDVRTLLEIQEEEIPKPLKIVIFRILQEAMNNVAKHSLAQTVEILLCRDADSILLAVKDDGRGFDADPVVKDPFRKGLGLSSMKERAELSEGVFKIESRPSEGTRIEVLWPVTESTFSDL